MKQMSSEEALEKYRRAGQIASKAREELKRVVREDMPIIDVCEKAEEIIAKKGGKAAFPCNVSVNEVAAHYSSPPGDERRIPKGSLVKIDIGAHVDGYIADTAATVCFNSSHEKMVLSAELALEKAIKIICSGLPISIFGTEVQRVIKNSGMKPVSNLTGHQIGRYVMHSGKSLPNISHFSIEKIRPGEVYAIEPFVTMPDAAGKVESSSEAYIFRSAKQKSLKNANSKYLLKHINQSFRTLPFSERWLRNYMNEKWYRQAFSELLSTRSLMSYPVFVEASRKPVAQAEHTVFVGEKEVVVLT